MTDVDTAATDDVGGSAARWSGRTFLLALLLITAVGLSIRLGALVLRPVCPDTAKPADVIADECYYHNGDGFWYHTTANLIAEDGEWFKTYSSSFALVETAQHPPLYTLYLAAWSKVGADSVAAHRAASDTTVSSSSQRVSAALRSD